MTSSMQARESLGSLSELFTPMLGEEAAAIGAHAPDASPEDGDWYCAPGWDDCTGYLNGIFMNRRSEAGDRIVEWVLRHRKDPELKCPNFSGRDRTRE